MRPNSSSIFTLFFAAFPVGVKGDCSLSSWEWQRRSECLSGADRKIAKLGHESWRHDVMVTCWPPKRIDCETKIKSQRVNLGRQVRFQAGNRGSLQWENLEDISLCNVVKRSNNSMNSGILGNRTEDSNLAFSWKFNIQSDIQSSLSLSLSLSVSWVF